MDVKVLELAKKWLEWDKNERTKHEIQELLDKHDMGELKKLLIKRMEFGTAGLRARMGAGNSQMNDLTIIQTTQGFAKYMLEVTPYVVDKGVIIGYDARHNSRRFAQLAATVLINSNIRVFLCSQITPTPYIPYGIKQLGATWGIMVTASHNPKEDNGYKVYFENGAQIIPPHDSGIARKIEQNLEPLASSWQTDILENHPRLSDPYKQLHHDYMRDLTNASNFRDTNHSTKLRFTYTAMHGVGYEFVKEAFKQFNFPPCIPVKEQVEPDPMFPTVKFPNPEEGESALDLAMRTADEHGSTVILANDPDADRLAVAEKLPQGRWCVFSGNELGALLGWWLVAMHKQSRHFTDGSDVYLLASTVSSKILKSIASLEGLNFIETLTGFKWMGNKAHELMQDGKTVLFAFEEAIGFMCGTTVLDKDGISAAMVCTEMATYLANEGLSMSQQLEKIYEKYGYHISKNSYFICHDSETISNMFERLRKHEDSGKYVDHCGTYKIKAIRDLTTGYDSDQVDQKAVLPVSSSSQMITFTFENGCVATIRTSGTEPKIKYYTEFCADPKKGLTRADVTQELDQIVQAIIENFYEPERNNLIARSS